MTTFPSWGKQIKKEDTTAVIAYDQLRPNSKVVIRRIIHNFYFNVNSLTSQLELERKGLNDSLALNLMAVKGL